MRAVDGVFSVVVVNGGWGVRGGVGGARAAWGERAGEAAGHLEQPAADAIRDLKDQALTHFPSGDYDANADAPANARLRTLIHECAHALGIDYRSYSRAQAEVMVETVTHLAASTVGLAVDGETIPYVSGWGEDGALEAVTEFAEAIDRVARRIEDVLLAGAEHASSQPQSRAA